MNLRPAVLFGIIVLGCQIFCASSAKPNSPRLTVTYLSAENVYVNGGEANGLTIGTQLIITGSSGERARLEVIFAAAHSASCKVISKNGEIHPGDVVEMLTAPLTDTTSHSADTSANVTAVSVSVAQPEEAAVPKPKPIRKTVPVTGSFSIQYYNWHDQTATGLDFSQLTTRLSLKARRLWGKEITLSVRGRGRMDKRVRSYRADVARDAWQNRLWEFSLRYDEPRAPVHAAVGRILPEVASSAGYLDGALIEAKLSSPVHLGLFGGSSPRQWYDDDAVALTRIGGYVSLESGDYQNLATAQSAGFVSETHGSEPNREYLFVQGRLNQGTGWGESHSAEIDVNTGWRKERAGSSLVLSNIFLSTWLRPADWLRLSVSYDNRTNYWTLANKSTVDSLFDTNLRQGVRAQSELMLPGQLMTSVSTSFRRESDSGKPTWAYSGYLRKGNLLSRSLSLSLQYASFNGDANKGSNYLVRTDWQAGSTLSFGLAYAGYRYQTASLPGAKNNQLLEWNGQYDLSRHLWLNSFIQSASGDDSRGLRVQTECGYRF